MKFGLYKSDSPKQVIEEHGGVKLSKTIFWYIGVYSETEIIMFAGEVNDHWRYNNKKGSIIFSPIKGENNMFELASHTGEIIGKYLLINNDGFIVLKNINDINDSISGKYKLIELNS